jgi:hypothetical protein
MSNKIKQILDRLDDAASCQRNTDNWNDHKNNLSAPEGMDYWEWIEQAGLLAILEHDALTARVAQLENGYSQILSEIASTSHAENYKLLDIISRALEAK